MKKMLLICLVMIEMALIAKMLSSDPEPPDTLVARSVATITTKATTTTSTTSSTTVLVPVVRQTATTQAPAPPPIKFAPGSMEALIAEKFGPYSSKAIQVAKCESHLNPNAHNSTPPDDSYGLFQINMYGDLGPDRREAYGFDENSDLFDPTRNIAIAYSMSNGGRSWGAWSCG